MRYAAAALLIALAACGGGNGNRAAGSSPAPAATVTATDDGRLIFTTGRDANGVPIAASPAAMRSSCIQCHRANGAGGVKFPDGAVSADLRHKALVTDQKPPYTIPLLERAISRGIDNQGEKLDPVMPRWRMSPRDLYDVAAYVYRQLK